MVIENGVLKEVTDEDIVNGRFEFPDNVTEIGNRAFSGCSELTSISIPPNITNIRDGVFQNCSKLTSINLSNFDTSHVILMNRMFWNCYYLKSLDLSNFNTSSVIRTTYRLSLSADQWYLLVS